ncbi:YbaB/EbfC family nucleoid-associated protein [Actinoplanes teichomyceticus]|uniref:YbaB/EbfC DNA-binding family protein n=1 Tax=Actinoplanes teichomyceticus TaxID=1867 RepID=A0A561WNP6_ACTTI|nr:YbaB/EbfC family nucleoid-associated protein [Actinoplanes teichomyceticus]TWG25489.1 YbaB/EbfC DNA-binding family protein [Actinoplanes teichomyceticus]GIF10558.1 hypothetical protein Ate01nite_05900 [Actinoplanes teichomyceticus]
MVSDETQAWFRGLVKDTQQRLGALSSLQEDPERFQGRAEEGGVTVVVAPGGNLVDLKLTRHALQLGPDELAATILRAQRAAVRQANVSYAAAVQDAVGDAAGAKVDVAALVEQRLDQAGLRKAAENLEGSGR